MNKMEIDMREEMKNRGLRMYKQQRRKEVIGTALQMFFCAVVVYLLAVLILAIW